MALQPKTAVEAFNSPTNSVVKLKSELGETVLNAFLSLALTELVESFNVGKTMNAMQIVFVIETIKTDYYFLKIEELKFCFNEAKRGRYGTMYDRIDSAVICEWIEKYLEQRMEIAYQQNVEEQKNHLLTENKIGEVLSKLNIEFKVAEPQKKEIKKREYTEEEILIQEILTQFDDLHEKTEKHKYTGGSRFVNYKNKRLTQSEFLEVRLNEMNKI